MNKKKNWLHFGVSFFFNLHQKVRKENCNISGKNQKMGFLMLKAYEMTQHDLIIFFGQWVFAVEESYHQDITALGLPAPDEGRFS